jgi:hypothetical protein
LSLVQVHETSGLKSGTGLTVDHDAVHTTILDNETGPVRVTGGTDHPTLVLEERLEAFLLLLEKCLALVGHLLREIL